MSTISPFKTANILPPTIPPVGPSLSSESEDEGAQPETQTGSALAEHASVQSFDQNSTNALRKLPNMTPKLFKQLG